MTPTDHKTHKNYDDTSPNFLGTQSTLTTNLFDSKQQMYNYEYFDEHVQPVYVNLKQLGCIQKRKARRDYLDTLMAEQKHNYLHESRHRHAMKRMRAPSGRFLTKEETEQLLKNESLQH